MRLHTPRLWPGLFALLASACNWLSLAEHALTYDTVARGETESVVSGDALFYATRAEDGLAVLDVDGRLVLALAPAPGMESVDDLARDGELLFALDARLPGHLAVYSLGEARRPRLVAGPVPVPVGPFSGVSAHDGLAVVSGGTSSLTVWRCDRRGALEGPTATADVGRGQPNALLAPDAGTLFVASHYWGPYFGLTVLATRADTLGHLTTLGKTEIAGAGFTDGGAKPASFPMGLAALDDTTLLLAHERGLAVVDVRQPARPAVRRVIALGGPAVSVDVLDGIAAVSVAGDAPAVALVTFPAAGEGGVTRLPLPSGTRPLGVALSRARIAVAARDRGLLIFNR